MTNLALQSFEMPAEVGATVFREPLGRIYLAAACRKDKIRV